MNRYEATVELPVGIEEAFAYHERPGCLRRLTPPWESVQIEQSDDSLTVGSRVVLKTKLFGVPVRWVAEHTAYDPPNLFADTQVSGPFAKWDHRHEFSGETTGRSHLTDDVHYDLPIGKPGEIFGSGVARRAIESMFAYRHRVTADDLTMARHYNLPPQSFAISGATGLVGNALSTLLTILGHRTKSIVRSESSTEDEIAIWNDPNEVAKFDDVDVVVHLAGKPIAGKRWTEDVKRGIRESRVQKTRDLCEALARCRSRPSVLVCASATGIYGDRGDETLTESSEYGDDFLAEVAEQWEAACQPAVDAGIRVVNARFGLILSPQGGALPQMLLPAKLMGGKLGGGQQWWSWIALDDVLGAIFHCVATPDLAGPVNFTAPEPIRNVDFAETLGNVIGRPALVPAPAFALRLALGEMADALLLSSTRVIPTTLQQSGYAFRFTDLREQLDYCLGYQRKPSEQTSASPAG